MLCLCSQTELTQIQRSGKQYFQGRVGFLHTFVILLLNPNILDLDTSIISFLSSLILNPLIPSSNPGTRHKIPMKGRYSNEGSNQKLSRRRPLRMFNTDRHRAVQCRSFDVCSKILEPQSKQQGKYEEERKWI